MAALMICTTQSVFYCIFLSFASGGRSATSMDHGTMFHLTFGRTRATQLPRKMGRGGRSVCVVLSQALHHHSLW